MARPPTVKLPSVSSPVTGADIADFARRVGAEPVDVDVVFAAASTASARHGMGHRYVGGIVIGVTATHTANIAVVEPDTASATVDPATYVMVDAGGTYTGTVRVRVL